MNKRTSFIGLGIILIGLALIMFFVLPLTGSRQPGPVITPTSSSSASSQTYEGTLTCLPPKGDGGVHTLECAIGLKTSDGRYYGIEDSSSASARALQQSNGTKLKVTGILRSDAQLSAKYDVVGIIKTTRTVEAFK